MYLPNSLQVDLTRQLFIQFTLLFWNVLCISYFLYRIAFSC